MTQEGHATAPQQPRGKKHKNRQKPQQPSTAAPERRESAKDRKLRLINDDNSWNVVRNRTPDTAEFVNLLNANDNLLYRLRMTNFERSGNLTYEDLMNFIKRSNEIKDSINQLNIDLSKAMGVEYIPPRGYTRSGQKKPQTAQQSKPPRDQAAAASPAAP